MRAVLANLQRRMTQTFASGKREEALELGKRLFTITENELGSRHTEHLEIANCYANVLMSCERFKEAETILEENVKKYTEVLGREHTGTVTSMILLGKV
jgi:hypothetical protein